MFGPSPQDDLRNYGMDIFHSVVINYDADDCWIEVVKAEEPKPSLPADVYLPPVTIDDGYRAFDILKEMCRGNG